jgi:hypothetical protein
VRSATMVACAATIHIHLAISLRSAAVSNPPPGLNGVRRIVRSSSTHALVGATSLTVIVA